MRASTVEDGKFGMEIVVFLRFSLHGLISSICDARIFEVRRSLKES